VIEEIAYLWFNRFIALRYMEVNNYLSYGSRVVSSDNKSINDEMIESSSQALIKQENSTADVVKKIELKEQRKRETFLQIFR